MITICGISDPTIIAGYALSIGFALACILYGLVNWNRGGS
ncbi:symporter small accessory protein [Methanospirillum sp.]|nr:symporter small accessory protein [Methanospirillum sp.]